MNIETIVIPLLAIIILLALACFANKKQQRACKYYTVYHWSQNGWAEVINCFQFDSSVPISKAVELLSGHFDEKVYEENLKVWRTNNYLAGDSSRKVYPLNPSPLGGYTSETIPQVYQPIKYFKGYLTKPQSEVKPS